MSSVIQSGGTASTLADLTGGGFWYPAITLSESSTLGFGTGVPITASGHKVAYVFIVPRTGTLDKFEWRLSTVTQAPASGLRCSFQPVNTSNGDPDEPSIPSALVQYRDVTSGLTANTWIVPGLMTTDGTDGGAKRSVVVGEYLACVVEFVSFAAGDNLRVFDGFSGTTIVGTSYNQYRDNKITGAWVKTRNPLISLALKYNDGTYAYTTPMALPYLLGGSAAYGNATNPDERGMIFKFPKSVKVSGAYARLNLGLGTADIVLYDTDGSTPLATVSLDPDMDTGSDSSGNAFVYFPSAITLQANTNYYLTLKPTSATTVTIYSFTVNSAAIMGAFEGGANFLFTDKNDGGSFSAPVTTQRPFMGLYVTAIGG